MINRKMTYSRGINAHLGEQDIANAMTEEDFKKQKFAYLLKLAKKELKTRLYTAI